MSGFVLRRLDLDRAGGDLREFIYDKLYPLIGEWDERHRLAELAAHGLPLLAKEESGACVAVGHLPPKAAKGYLHHDPPGLRIPMLAAWCDGGVIALRYEVLFVANGERSSETALAYALQFMEGAADGFRFIAVTAGISREGVFSLTRSETTSSKLRDWVLKADAQDVAALGSEIEMRERVAPATGAGRRVGIGL